MDNILQFRQDLVDQGLLTKDEAQYVYNGNVKWAISKVQTASAYNISLAIFQDTAGSIAKKLNGKTWTAVPALAKIETYDLRVYNNVIYVETKYNVLYESRDNSKTFKQNKTINHAYLDYIYSDQNTIYVGATRELYESTDKGKHLCKDLPANLLLLKVKPENQLGDKE